MNWGGACCFTHQFPTSPKCFVGWKSCTNTCYMSHDIWERPRVLESYRPGLLLHLRKFAKPLLAYFIISQMEKLPASLDLCAQPCVCVCVVGTGKKPLKSVLPFVQYRLSLRTGFPASFYICWLPHHHHLQSSLPLGEALPLVSPSHQVIRSESELGAPLSPFLSLPASEMRLQRVW